MARSESRRSSCPAARRAIAFAPAGLRRRRRARLFVATHPAVSPRAADDCIAPTMRKSSGARLTSDAALLSPGVVALLVRHGTHRERPRLLQRGAAVGRVHYRIRGDESPAAV